jgi:zinc/manganese transport system substrate-binding protein
MRIRIIIVIFSFVPRPKSLARAAVPFVAAALICVAFTGCGAGITSAVGHGAIHAVGAESQYANVISQIGGRYVSVTAVLSNPNTDPHSFEASPSVAQSVSGATLIVQNGVGYDGFMNKIESATGSSSRNVIDVQRLLGIPDSTRNPHLWYQPLTMLRVAAQVAKRLAALAPGHAAYFASRARRFDASLRPWFKALGAFGREHPHTPVATTEPVGDYMLQAAGARIMTPWSLQADVMNGVDPAPQDISREDALFKDHRVRIFLYNQQVTDTLTQSFLKQAARYHVPVVGVYETMPAGFSYQSWMLAEVAAMNRALTTGKSTTRL